MKKLKIAVIPNGWKVKGISFQPLFELIEKKHDVTYFDNPKDFKGDFDVVWIHSIRRNRNIKTKIPVVWMPHGNMTFTLETEKQWICQECGSLWSYD